MNELERPWTADQLLHIINQLKAEDPRVPHIQTLQDRYLKFLLYAIQEGTIPPPNEFAEYLQLSRVPVDRKIPIDFGAWTYKLLLNPEKQRQGPSVHNVLDLKMMWPASGPITFLEVFRYLETSQILDQCFTWIDLKAFQKRGAFFYRRHFKGMSLVAWASVSKHHSETSIEQREIPTNWQVPVLHETNNDSLSISWKPLRCLIMEEMYPVMLYSKQESSQSVATVPVA